jgi:C4-dicarboxylate-specific signal transduction histidine kinase
LPNPATGAAREVFGRRRDGSEVRVEVGLNAIHAPGGAAAVLASVVDVTERRRAEQEAARQRNELTHLSRVTMLGELSGSLAHELNQPLTAILSNAQAALKFLENDPGDVGEVRSILEDIVADDSRAGEVIHRLRLMFSNGEVQHRELDVAEAIREVLRLLNSELVSHNVVVRGELAAGLPPVWGDRVQLQQVLINLIINGCDAMVDAQNPDRTLFVRAEPANGAGVRVSVEDRGCGIAPDRLESVFEPFFTTKTRGMGLGLAVCRTIIAAHGGRLWAENNVGRGASFMFLLPVNGATGA